jgi:hypothetical protein
MYPIIVRDRGGRCGRVCRLGPAALCGRCGGIMLPDGNERH